MLMPSLNLSTQPLDYCVLTSFLSLLFSLTGIQSHVLFNFPISPFPPGTLLLHGSELSSEQNLNVPVGHLNAATMWPQCTLLVLSPSTPP